MNNLDTISIRKFVAYKIRKLGCDILEHRYKFRTVGVTLPNSDAEINIETMICTRCRDIDPEWEEHTYKKVKKLFLGTRTPAY